MPFDVCEAPHARAICRCFFLHITVMVPVRLASLGWTTSDITRYWTHVDEEIGERDGRQRAKDVHASISCGVPTRFIP